MNNKENNKHDLLLTSKEAAAELKVSESFLAKARMRGTGPAFIQIGRAVREGIDRRPLQDRSIGAEAGAVTGAVP